MMEPRLFWSPLFFLHVAVCLQEALELGASVLLMDEDTCTPPIP
jgi:hypothetical protein